MNRIYKTLTLLIYLIPIIGWSSSPKKNLSCDMLLLYLNKPHKEVFLDTPPQNMSKKMLNLRRLIIQTEPGEFDALWKTLSKNDFMEIVDKVRKGQLEVQPEQKDKLFALEEFILRDEKNVLWTGSNGAWSSLHTYYPDFMGPSHKTRLGGTIARIDTYTLTELEKEIYNAALSKASRFKRGTIWQRLFRHPLRVFENITRYNNQIRERLEHLEDIPAAVERELKEETPDLTNEEIKEINSLLSLMNNARKNLREELTQIYGQDITTGGFQAVGTSGDVDIYVIDKKIRDLGVIQSKSTGEYILISENVIDGLNRILNQSRTRKRLQVRTESDQDPIELRVRHYKHRRQYEIYLNEWVNHMSKGTGESIQVGYYWYETELYTVQERGPDGKVTSVQKSKQVRKSNSALVEMSFYDVLVNRMTNYSVGRSFREGTIESISGKSRILEKSVEAAKIQLKYFDLLELKKALIKKLEVHAQNVLSTSGLNREDHEISKSLLKDLKTLEVGLQDLINQNKDNQSEVIKRWKNDDYEHFLARNKKFESVLNELIEVYQIYYEQWLRGEYELVITPDILTHNWKALKLRYYGAIGANVIGASTLTGLSICTGHHFISDYGSCLTALWQTISPYIDQLSLLF